MGPTHLLWAVEGSSAEHQRQHLYITRSSNLLQEHQYGEMVGPWPQEDAPEETAEVISAFIDTLDPTPLPATQDDIPEHVKRQFEEMERTGETHAGCSGHDHGHDGGHSHNHGGAAHSHSHSHGGGG